MSQSHKKMSLKRALSHGRLVFLSLFYNSHLSWSYAFDTVLEPLFYLVDNFAKVLGPIFVAGAILGRHSIQCTASNKSENNLQKMSQTENYATFLVLVSAPRLYLEKKQLEM